jgi:hypothetical protein
MGDPQDKKAAPPALVAVLRTEFLRLVDDDAFIQNLTLIERLAGRAREVILTLVIPDGMVPRRRGSNGPFYNAGLQDDRGLAHRPHRRQSGLTGLAMIPLELVRPSPEVRAAEDGTLFLVPKSRLPARPPPPLPKLTAVATCASCGFGIIVQPSYCPRCGESQWR